MPMERSADGLIKHIINERMDTKECCIDIYMQFIAAGKATGTSRHLSEESPSSSRAPATTITTTCISTARTSSSGKWDTTPKKFEWGPGDFIYIPPYVAHKRFNTSDIEARVIVVNSRIMKAIGLRLVRPARAGRRLRGRLGAAGRLRTARPRAGQAGRKSRALARKQGGRP